MSLRSGRPTPSSSSWAAPLSARHASISSRRSANLIPGVRSRISWSRRRLELPPAQARADLEGHERPHVCDGAGVGDDARLQIVDACCRVAGASTSHTSALPRRRSNARSSMCFSFRLENRLSNEPEGRGSGSRPLAHEGSAVATALTPHATLARERVQRLAHGDPAHAVRVGELSLRGQPAARRELQRAHAADEDVLEGEVQWRGIGGRRGIAQRPRRPRPHGGLCL